TDYRHGVVRPGLGQRQQVGEMQAECATQPEQAKENAEDAAYPAAADLGRLRIPEYLMEERVGHGSSPSRLLCWSPAHFHSRCTLCRVVFVINAHVRTLATSIVCGADEPTID